MDNIVVKTRERIDAIIGAMMAKYQKLTNDLEETYRAIEEQRQRVKEAAAACDIETYKAEAAKLTELTNSAKEMEAWQRDLWNADRVSEKESEETIAALRAYNAEINRAYEKAVADMLRKLIAITEQRNKDSNEAYNVVNAWTSRIRPNYISPDTIYAATGTHKNDKPVPIHPEHFRCPYAKLIEQFVDNPQIVNLLHKYPEP